MYDETRINQEYERAVQAAEDLFLRSKEALRERMAHTESLLAGRRTELEQLERQLQERDGSLEISHATLFRAYSSITLGILGFLGSSSAMAWILRAMLPPEILSRVNFLSKTAEAIQAALIAMSLQKYAAGGGFVIVVIGIVWHYFRTDQVTKSRAFGYLLVGIGGLLVILAYYPFDPNSQVDIIEGAFAATALASPLLVLLRIPRVRAAIEASLQTRYAGPGLLALLLLVVICLSVRFYPPILAVILFASACFYELLVEGSSMRRQLHKYASDYVSASDLRKRIDSLEQERIALQANLEVLPRSKSSAVWEADEARRRRLWDLDQERRWRGLIDGRKQ